jgi:hypothetical protein
VTAATAVQGAETAQQQAAGAAAHASCLSNTFVFKAIAKMEISDALPMHTGWDCAC